MLLDNHNGACDADILTPEEIGAVPKLLTHNGTDKTNVLTPEEIQRWRKWQARLAIVKGILSKVPGVIYALLTGAGVVLGMGFFSDHQAWKRHDRHEVAEWLRFSRQEQAENAIIQRLDTLLRNSHLSVPRSTTASHHS